MLLNQISTELEQDKERRQQPRLTRGLYWIAISLVFFVSWCVRLYRYSGHFGATEVLGLFSAFLILGFGFREFAKYYMVTERGDGNLSTTDQQQLGSVLNLATVELSNRRVPPSRGLTQAAVPGVTESTTQHLDVKPQEHK